MSIRRILLPASGLDHKDEVAAYAVAVARKCGRLLVMGASATLAGVSAIAAASPGTSFTMAVCRCSWHTGHWTYG